MIKNSFKRTFSPHPNNNNKIETTILKLLHERDQKEDIPFRKIFSKYNSLLVEYNIHLAIHDKFDQNIANKIEKQAKSIGELQFMNKQLNETIVEKNKQIEFLCDEMQVLQLELNFVKDRDKQDSS